MKFLLFAAFLGFSNVTLAQAGCALDPTGNGAVEKLKDVHLQFKPTNDRPNQICTGDGTLCLYSKDNGKTPCQQSYDMDTHKPEPPKCGEELLKAQNDAGDNQYQSASQFNRGATGPQTNNFYYSFVKTPTGKYAINIEPQKSADDSKRDSGKDLKIRPSDAMGSNDVVIETYDGGGDPFSQCPIETTTAGGGAAASSSCPEPIKLIGSCTARRDASGNWFSVSNDPKAQPGSKVVLTKTKSYGNVSTNGSGYSTASGSTAGSW